MFATTLALILTTLALGSFALLQFMCRWFVAAPTRLSSALLLIAVFAAFLKVFLLLKPRLPQSLPGPDRHWASLGLPFFCVMLGVCKAGYWIIRDVIEVPHGAWDAFAVWNLAARFLYRGNPDIWKDLFTSGWSHSDYPLLLAGLVSGGWRIAGAELPVIPAVLSILVGALSLAILCTAIFALSRDERAWAAGLILLATPDFVLRAANQTADLPIGLFILATVVLLQFAEACPQVRQWMLALAGLSAGLAAWTKNEGLLFVLALVGSYLVAHVFLGAWRTLRSNIVMIVCGLAPALILILSFKVLLAPPSIHVSSATLHQTIEHGFGSGQYVQIAGAFLAVAGNFGAAWNGGIHPAILLAFYLLLYAAPAKKINPTLLSLLVLIGFMLAGFFMVYAMSPLGGRSLARATLSRLLIQLWPACLFILATFTLSGRSDTDLPKGKRSRNEIHARAARTVKTSRVPVFKSVFPN